jgi:hypothetical protein
MTDWTKRESIPELLGLLGDALEQVRENDKPYTGDGVIDIQMRDMDMLTCPVLNGVGHCVSGCRTEPECCVGGPWTPRDAQGRYLGNEITRDQLKAIAAERWRTSYQKTHRDRSEEQVRREAVGALAITVRRYTPGDEPKDETQ